jgi:Helicase conserved C-terminal domain
VSQPGSTFLTVATTLARWLGTLTPEALGGLLSRRPEALAPPSPRDLADLAGRLQGRQGVLRAYEAMTLPAVQLVEVVLAFQCGSRAELAGLVGEDGLDDVLRLLADYALVWEFEGRLALAGELASAHVRPLRLGPGMATLLDHWTPAELRGLAAALGLEVPASKREVVRELADRFADGDWVRSLAASAPTGAEALLDRLTWQNPGWIAEPPPDEDAPEPPKVEAEKWLVQHGLLHVDNLRLLTMPREVAVALRGPGWRPPFDHRRPRPRLVALAPEAIAGEAAAAASTLVDQVTAVLCSGSIARLKAGGVGTREQRRLARLIGADETTTRLAVDLARGAGLLAGVADEMLPTDQFDDWLSAEPADRLLPLLAAWLGLQTVPLADATAAAPEIPGRITVDVRTVLLGVAKGLPDGQGIADAADLEEAVRWQAPRLTGYRENIRDYIRPLWTEAARLGLVAHGALSPLGRALLDMDSDALAAAARDLLEHATATAIFQADLTAVVAGPPGGQLCALLDGAADRESRGAASTWRFSAGSVRRALDAGYSADELLGRLRAVAADSDLPQPLEYLVRDAARRHGEIRVRGVSCVLRAADPALLTELLSCRALSGLGLTALAPTVLASAARPAETLAALRSAGYAPVGEDSSGVALIEKAERRRARPPVARRAPEWTQEPPRRHPLAVDPTELAAFLLAPPLLGTPPKQPQAIDLLPKIERKLHVVRQPTLEVIDAKAPQLDPEQRRLLADAIDDQQAIRIDYVDGDGRFSSRVIEEIELSGAVIEAWCRLREDERMFLLDRIDAVSPA